MIVTAYMFPTQNRSFNARFLEQLRDYNNKKDKKKRSSQKFI